MLCRKKPHGVAGYQASGYYLLLKVVYIKVM